MDKAPLMEYIHGMNHALTDDLLDDMIGCLTEEQFEGCLRRMFQRTCEKERDVDRAIAGVVENVWFGIESSYYDDDESEPSFDDISECLRDRFHFVRAMFAADLEDEAVDYCRRIAEGLDRTSANESYPKVRDILESERDRLSDLIGKGECVKWFEYR